MTGQVEIRVTAPGFADGEVLDRAINRAATTIYADFPQGGPCVAGSRLACALTCLLTIDDETPDAWLPQLHVLVRAVEGPIDSVTVEPFDE